MPKPTPTHHSRANGVHPIFLGRSSDGHQNPICRTCGKTLDLEEFEKLRAAGLVTC